MKKIGVSGARLGPSTAQQDFIDYMFVEEQDAEVHHGDCLGVDAAVHAAARKAGHRVVVHPPDRDIYRAFCVGSEVHQIASYRARNQAIVDAVDVLYGFPEGPEDVFLRSGTWMTIRMALRRGIPVFEVLPHGELKKHG
jgi:hypothetical protein